MHQALHITEILLNIFGHCSTESLPGRHSYYSADLVVLARTCQTFKEPALDVLWEELYDLSPLARCLPEACYLVGRAAIPRGYCWRDNLCYSFSRPLKEVEWNTLRGYACRVRFIHASSVKIIEETIRMVFSLAPFDDPLFPHLRSLYWNGTITFSPPHIAVSSLKILHLDFHRLSLLTVKELEYLDVFGDRCPHMEVLVVDNFSSDPMDSAISRLVCRWPKLQRVACSSVALSMDAISHLSSVSSLKSLKFRVEISLIRDISHLDSKKLVFSSLTDLDIRSRLLDTITSLLHYIQLPAIEALSVTTEGYISRRAIQAYWAAVRDARLSNVLTYLKLYSNTVDEGEEEEEEEEEVSLDEEVLPCLTLHDLPCTAFAELRGLEVDMRCPVSLTDADLLELVSPRMEYFLINRARGWQIGVDGGGITLSGLVQLLRQCPSLNRLCLAIDSRTFTEIPEGLDVSFPPRIQLRINLLDSYIPSQFVQGLVSVFVALGLDSSMLPAWGIYFPREFQLEWKRVERATKESILKT